VEELVASLWREALGLSRVSIDDDFFALGGHSLLASQVLARLRRDHGVELSFRKMFEAPTIAQFALLVEASGSNAAKDLPIPRRAGNDPAPLSLAQERMFLLEQMEPGRAVVHNLPAAWRLRGPLDVAALARALDAIVQRHETLRTTFSLEGGRPLQVIHPPATQALPVIDLTGHVGPERERTAIAFCDARALEPADLSKGPLFRTWLLRLDEDDHVLSILPHNTIWDGWSFDLFLKELDAHYVAFASGRTPTLSALPMAYADYAVWQRASQAGPAFARQVEYWRRQLAGPPPTLELPLDHPRPESNEHRGADEVLQFSTAEVDALTALGRAHGATLFMVLFAGYNALLHRVTGLADVTVGAPTRARSRPEFEELIGPFVNAVVLRTQVEDAMGFGQLVERVRDVTLEAFNYQDMPLEALGAKPPVVRNFFSLQDARTRPVSLGGLELSQVHVLPPAAQADTMIWFMEGKEGLLAVLNFNTAIFERATAARLLRGLRTLLLEAARTPEATIGDLPAAADEDRAAVEGLASASGKGASSATLVDVLARTAGEGVLASGTEPLTRHGLQDASVELAAALAAAGLRAAGRVGLHLESGRDLLLGLAGTLRAGGVATTLDVTSSVEVLRSQLQGAELSVVVTRRERRDDVDGLAPVVVCIDELAPAQGAPAVPVAGDPAILLPVPGEEGTRWVASSHRSMVNVLTALAEAGVVAANDTVAVVNPPGHELALLEAMAALAGAALVTAPAEADPIEALDLQAATVAFVPTSRLASLVDSGWTGNGRLKLVAVGPPPAGALQAALLGRCAALWHVWGHPSIGLVLTLRRVESADDRALLGRPITGVRLDVLDAKGKPQPQGTTGSMRASGAMFAAPVTSGFRARWTADGQLEAGPDDGREAFHRGWRFMPAQIERVLAAHEAVARAAVQVRRGAGGEEEFVAYVVRRGSEEFTTTELRRHLRRSFPRPLVPGIVVEVQALPESAPGVIDRSRLQALDPDRAHRFIAPSTPSEQLLAGIWKSALGLDRVSTSDKFFDLGGYSLLCFQMIEQIEQQTGKRLHPRSFVLDTLGQLAGQLG
jgi:non-ribosomal peptide synthetase component F/aryl carrier-like protein